MLCQLKIFAYSTSLVGKYSESVWQCSVTNEPAATRYQFPNSIAIVNALNLYALSTFSLDSFCVWHWVNTFAYAIYIYIYIYMHACTYVLHFMQCTTRNFSLKNNTLYKWSTWQLVATPFIRQSHSRVPANIHIPPPAPQIADYKQRG